MLLTADRPPPTGEEMNNPFSWDYLTTAPATDDVFDVFGTACLVLFVVGFVASLLLSNDVGRRFVRHPVRRRLLRRIGGAGTAIFGAGIFFFGIRALNFPLFTFERPIWLLLTLLVAVAAAIYFWRVARTRLPAQMRAFEQQQVKQRYLRPTAPSSRQRPVPASRAARRPRA